MRPRPTLSLLLPRFIRPSTAMLLFGVLLGSAACREDRVAGPSAELATAAVALTYEWANGGGQHSCISRASSPGAWTKLCWGLNSSGEVGNGSLSQQILRPTAVTNTTGGTFIGGDAGYGHTCTLRSSGGAYCWGRNDFGQLGNGTTTKSTVPKLVSGGITWRQISTGWFHTCGIDNIGVAYCWGQGTFGKLGNGGTANKLVPTPVSTANGFVTLSLGENFTCGVSNFAPPPVAIYCWGNNSFGQLGNGNTTDLLKPGLSVAGGAMYATITTGSTHACALKWPSALAVCWGNNSSNQMGNSETTHKNQYTIPQPVAFNYRLGQLSAGASHTCAKRDTGRIYCWGRGDLGQLGNGFFVNRPTPYPVYGDFSYQDKLAAGNNHMIAVRSDGVVVSWGVNTFGQLGDGTTNTRGAPVVILPASQ